MKSPAPYGKLTYSANVDRLIYSPWTDGGPDDEMTDDDYLILSYAALDQAGAYCKGLRGIDRVMQSLVEKTHVLELIENNKNVAESMP